MGRKPVTTRTSRGVTDSLVMAKEMFPGKRNGLDALCDRLGVDNSGRTLHGALLDAELLADVYINMTRGQDALLIDLPATARRRRCHVAEVLDLRQFELPVLLANEQEARAHEGLAGRPGQGQQGQRRLWRALQKPA